MTLIFSSRPSKSGPRLIINIPKNLHNKVKHGSVWTITMEEVK